MLSLQVRLSTHTPNTLSGPALGCSVVIGIVDVWLRPRTRSRLVEALLDETAHLATALLLLGALAPQRLPSYGVAAGLGGVLIDADHVPMEFFGWDILTHSTKRPYSHSFAGLLLTAIVASRLPAQYRPVGFALGAGVATHLARDLATGGISLFWPLTNQNVRLPYRCYAMLLGLALGLIVWREAKEGQPQNHTPDPQVGS